MIAAALAFAALAALPLDSQLVIERYVKALAEAPVPKMLVFSYSVSQAGPKDIEQTHRIYRRGDLVRDETLMADGTKQKTIRIARYRNRYALGNLAPRTTQYTFLFEGAQKNGRSFRYEYRAVPNPGAGAFIVDSIVIDATSFLPVVLRFHTTGANAHGTGSVTFAKVGKYWLAQTATAQAGIGGRPAREHIIFSAYRFPVSLPKSTFQAPKQLPAPALPTF